MPNSLLSLLPSLLESGSNRVSHYNQRVITLVEASFFT